MDHSYTSELQFGTYPPKVSKTLHFFEVTQINLTKKCGKLVRRKNNNGKMGSFYVGLYPCAPFYVHVTVTPQFVGPYEEIIHELYREL